jgi:hypothetical protein
VWPGIGVVSQSVVRHVHLDGLDYLVKRELKIRGYLRYMDDFVLCSDDRSQLV